MAEHSKIHTHTDTHALFIHIYIYIHTEPLTHMDKAALVPLLEPPSSRSDPSSMCCALKTAWGAEV